MLSILFILASRGRCDFEFLPRKHLNKREADLDEVQNAEFALRRVHTEDKVERRIVPVNQLVVRAADEAVRRKQLLHYGKIPGRLFAV